MAVSEAAGERVRCGAAAGDDREHEMGGGAPEPLPHREVLDSVRCVCSSQDTGFRRSWGQILGTGWGMLERWVYAVQGNKKAHLLAFCEAL
jgi:hypothetical protein